MEGKGGGVGVYLNVLVILTQSSQGTKKVPLETPKLPDLLATEIRRKNVEKYFNLI